jgi:hypothetical protein
MTTLKVLVFPGITFSVRGYGTGAHPFSACRTVSERDS